MSKLDHIRDDIFISARDFKKSLSNCFNSYDVITDVLERFDHAVELLIKNIDKDRLHLKKLSVNYDDIDAFVVDVKFFSEHVKLLALVVENEAKKAGSYGSECSLLSDEIWLLSIRLSELSEQVENIIENVDAVSFTASNYLDGIRSECEKLTDLILELVSVVQVLIFKSEDLLLLINTSYSVMFLRVVLLDHVIWKMGVYKMIEDKSYPEMNFIYNTQSSSFGCFYYEDRFKNMFSDCKSYKILNRLHEYVYFYGGRAIESFSENDVDKGMVYVDKMESSSVLIIQHIEHLKLEIKRINEPVI